MPHRTEAERSRLVAELAIAAVGIGTYDWDLVTGELVWDDRLLDLFGYTAETFPATMNGFYSRVHPDDVEPVRRALDDAAAVCGDYLIQYRVHPRPGEERWVRARGRMLPGPDGTAVRAIGAAMDLTEREAAEARVAQVLESMPTAFFSLDPEWRFTYVNAEAERVLARTREELLGGVLWDLFPAAVGNDFEVFYRRAAATGEAVSFDAFYPEPLRAWYEVRAWPSSEGLSVYFLDVTAARDARQAAERALERATLTARVTAELAETLDAEVAVARLAQLVVPELADWCVVTLVEEGPGGGDRLQLRDVGTWHVDEAQRGAVAEYAHLRLASLRDNSFLRRSIESREAVLVPGDAARAVHDVLLPGRARDLLDALAPATAAVLPMRARGRTLGALSLFNGPERGPLAPEDLVTVEEVAGRAGLALDNSRLYAQQRQRAETFQRSLLTQPAQPDHLEIVVRYVPAAEAAQVGGDWYDAFLQPSGATMLVIGDVVGHDVAAAAAMGQVRSVLRGIAVATGCGPAELLGQVDRALRTLQSDTIATALVARIEQTPEERAEGLTRMRWSTAGHPGPMLLDPDGSVHHLTPGVSDTLLGVRPDSPRRDLEVVVERGATVLLFTDGLVERRDRGLRRGFHLLRDTLEELAARDLDLETLCDQVLARMLPARPQDDVALVAVRLHPEDRPRPPEAGPMSMPPDVPPAAPVTPPPTAP